MKTKQHSFSNADGFTLIEVIIAIVILAVIALGDLTYQYYGALHSRAASARMTAARTAQLLIEDWKSAGGSAAYNPTALNLNFTDSDLGTAAYEITVDNLPMYLNLSYNDMEHDDSAQITLRKITVQVNWCNDHRVPTGQEDEPSMSFSTYARVDASGG